MIRYLFLFSLIVITIKSIAAPGAHGPNGEHITPDNKPSGELGRQPDGSVIIPMPHQALLNIRTQMVTTESVTNTLTLPAIVRPHPDGHAKVQPSSDGRFEAPDTGVLATGVRVTAGQVLGYIRYQDSAYELASQNSELKVVRNQIEQTQRDVKRLKSLKELTSKQVLDQLQTELKNLIEQEAAIKHALEKPEILVAPIDGTLINHQVRSGGWVEAGENLFEVVTPSLRMIEAMTKDTQTLSQFTQAQLLDFPQLNVSYIGHSPQLSGGMVSLYFEYRNTAQDTPSLLLDQPVTLVTELASNVTGIVLPARAVVKNPANISIVWIKISAERFLPQIVQYRHLDSQRVVITKGLGADNRVVVSGTSLLNQIR